MSFEELCVLYVKLDEQRWVLFVEKSKRQWSAKKQRAWKDAVIKYLEDDQRAAEARLQKALVDDLGNRLVIDPFHKTFTTYPAQVEAHSTNESHADLEQNQPRAQNSVQDENQDRSQPSSSPPVKARGRKPTNQKPKQGSRSMQPQSRDRYGHPALDRLRIDQDEDTDDDVPNFMFEHMDEIRKLDKGEQGE